MRITQVKRLASFDDLAAHLHGLGIDILVDAAVDPSGPLATSVQVHDGSAGTTTVANRFAILPMEGWDGTTDGRPTDLVRRRWGRFGTSGCGLVWGEATAVRPDGRANPNQLVIGAETVDDLAGTARPPRPGPDGRAAAHPLGPVRPAGGGALPAPHAHPELDGRAGSGPADVFGDDELDELAEQYVEAAVLAHQAGFDFVDVKHCHGYLLHELLSAYDRPGRYGGDLAGRTAFLAGGGRHPFPRPSWRSPCGCRPSICGPTSPARRSGSPPRRGPTSACSAATAPVSASI